MKSVSQFAVFTVAGGIAAAVNVLSRIAFGLVTPYEVSIVLAYICGMTVAYILNKRFVFPPSGRRMRDEYQRFAIVNILALMQVWIVSVGLFFYVFPMVGFAWHAETVAHVIGVAVPAVTSYFAHKHFSFSRRVPRRLGQQ